MACKFLDFKINGDKKNILHDSVSSREVSGRNVAKAIYLANELNNNLSEVISYMAADEKIKEKNISITSLDDIIKLNGNVRKRLFNGYYKKNNPGFSHEQTIRDNLSIGRFTEAAARNAAEAYTANLILTSFVNAKITHNYRNIIDTTIENITKNYENIWADIIKEIKETKKRGDVNNSNYLSIINDSSFKEYLSLSKEYNEELNLYKADGDKSRHSRLNALLCAIEAAKMNIIENHCNDTEKNNMALYSEILMNPDDWFDRVFAREEVSIFRSFYDNKSNKDFDFGAIDVQDESSIFNTNEDEAEETDRGDGKIDTSSYSKSEVKQSGFDVIDDKFKLELIGLAKLNAPYDYSSKQSSYEIDDYLGQRTLVDYRQLYKDLVDLTNNVNNISNQDSLYECLLKASLNDDRFYSIAPLVEKMRDDASFKNYVYSQLHTNRQKKTIGIINENGIDFIHSNATSNSESKLNRMIKNDAKYTYQFASTSRRSELFDISNNISNRNHVAEVLKTAINEMLPTLKLTNFERYCLNCEEDELKDIIMKMIDLYNKAISEQERKIKNKDIEDKHYMTTDESFDVEGQFDAARQVNSTLNELTNVLSKFVHVSIDFNHTNAAGNQSSDLLPVSYLSQIISRIQAGENDEGLKKLGEFLSQSEQYKYNPILFGIKDNNGNYKYKGLFKIELNGSISVDPNAKYMLDCYLFDGVRNDNNSESALYTQLSNADYYFTQFLANRQKISSYQKTEGINSERDNVITSLVPHFMKTPADAPKNFAIVIQSIMDANSWEIEGEQEYINKVINDIISNINKENPNDVQTNIFEVKKDQNKILYNKVEQETTEDGFATKPHEPITNLKELINILSGNSTDSYNILRYLHKNINKDNPSVGEFTLYYDYKGTDKQTYRLILDVEGTRVKRKVKDEEHYTNTVTNIRLKENGLRIIKKGKNEKGEIIYIKHNTFIKELNNLKEDIEKQIKTQALDNGTLIGTLKKDSNVYLGYRNRALSMVENAVRQLDVMFKRNEKGNLELINDTKNLFSYAHYDPRDGFTKLVNGKLELTGNIFQFIDFPIVNGYNASEELKNIFYGESDGILMQVYDNLIINPNSKFISINEKGEIVPNTDAILEAVTPVVDNFLEKYIRYIKDDTQQYKRIVEEYNDNYQDNIGLYDQIEFYLSSTLVNMSTADIFEGELVYYKNSQTFFKRGKEIQMSGKPYGGRKLTDAIGGPINDIPGQRLEYGENGVQIRDGFTGITIYNTKRKSQTSNNYREQITNYVDDQIKKGKINKSSRERIIEELVKPYESKTCVNDAISYITLEEFIRRRYLDGTLNDYKDLLDVIDKVQKGEMSIAEIDLNGIQARIQSQKNIYYDIQYDNYTKRFYPRQIKNSEHVLIPCLIEGTDLQKLYDFMIDNNIDQVNTAETSKAANKNVLEFFNKDTGEYNENIQDEYNDYESGNVQEIYYYDYLYKQQEVKDHVVNVTNKMGVQFSKKILDNLPVDGMSKDAAEKFINNYISNIKTSAEDFFRDMGWKMNENGEIVNADGSKELNLKVFYDKMKQEAARLGLNSNTLDYYNIEEGSDLPSMPLELGINIKKAQSIVNSLFNANITRQTISGWHGPQMTSLGFNMKINGTRRALQSHPKRWRNKTGDYHLDFVNEEEVKHYIETHPEKKLTIDDFELVTTNYVEVAIPRWDSNIPTYEPISFDEYCKTHKPDRQEYQNYIYNEKEKFDADVLLKLKEAGLDEHIGYRIPTEGKQSMAVFKVVAFTDTIQGSTIFVPDEWVTQTGSDFDIDTIYGMCHNFLYDKHTNRFIKHKPNYNLEEDEVLNRYTKYVRSTLHKIKSENIDSLNQSKRELVSKIDKLVSQLNELDINSEYNKNKNAFNEIDKKVNDLLYKFFSEDKRLMESINKTFKRIEEENTKNGKIDYDKINIEKLNYIKNVANSFAKTTSYEETLEKYKNDERYAPIFEAVKELEQKIEISKAIKIRQELKQTFINIDEINKDIKEENKRLVYEYEKIAKQAGLESIEEFAKRDITDQFTEFERNNEIVDAAINILTNGENVEECLSISTFEDIDHLVTYFNQKSSNKNKIIHAYEFSFQIKAFTDATVGKLLKARSVQFDTTTSMFGRMKAEFSQDLGIKVKYRDTIKRIGEKNGKKGQELDEPMYDLELLKTFKDDLDRVEKGYVVLNHTKFGWSSQNNRNVVDRLISVYGSQTTAHILDAIKSGAIPNENMFTFGPFKTIVSLGVDYFSAIGFLMQPAITDLCNIYHESNSLYIDDTSDIIKRANYELANKYGVKGINEYTSIDDINDAFFKLYGKEFAKVLGIKPVKNIEEFITKELCIDTGLLVKRMAEDSTLTTTEKAIMDFATLKMFERANNLYEIVNPIINCINPDKFGSKVDVYSNNEILKQIYKLGYADANDQRFVCKVNGEPVPVLHALYPEQFNPKSSIKDRINASLYSYQSAFLNYCTIPSVEISRQLFRTEREEFTIPYYKMPELTQVANEIRKTLNVDEVGEHIVNLSIARAVYKKLGLIDKVQSRLGIKFTSEQYFEFQKWLISSTFYTNKTLLTPLTVDKKGYFIENEDAKKPDENKASYKYWENEHLRIFGHYETVPTNIEFEHANEYEKLEQSEINTFAALTPAQKLLWIKKNFRDDLNILENLNVVEVKSSKSPVSSRIVFSEGISIETALADFNQLFYNKHPFARLFALDLIKYAFLVERFDFKYGHVTKIINNQALLAPSKNDAGFMIFGNDVDTTFIDSINTGINEITSDRYDSDSKLDMFVRSHPEYTKEIKLSNGTFSNEDKKKKIECFNDHMVNNVPGVYYIPAKQNDSHSADLIKMLLPNSDKFRSYIRLKKNVKDGTITKLYKIHYDYTKEGEFRGMLLYEIGTLSVNDFGEQSFINDNNTSYDYSLYAQGLIDYLNKQYNNDFDINDYDVKDLENFKIDEFKPVKLDESEIGYDLDMLPNNTPLYRIIHEAIEAKKANCEQFNKEFNENIRVLIAMDSMFDKQLDRLINNKKDVQSIDGIVYKLIKISKKEKTNIIKSTLKQNGGILREQIDRVYQDKSSKDQSYRDSDLYTDVNIYALDVVKNPNIDENVETANDELNRIDEERVSNSTTGCLEFSEKLENDLAITASEKVIANFAKYLYEEAKAENITRDYTESLTLYKYFINSDKINIHDSFSYIGTKGYDNMYKILEYATDYFKEKSADLIDKLTNFEVNGKTYAVNEKILYEELLNASTDKFYELVDLIMEASHFGDAIEQYTNLDVDIKDEILKQQLEQIKKAIESVKNSKFIQGSYGRNGAIHYMFEEYLKRKYTTNELMQSGILNVREIYGDISRPDMLIASMSDISDKEIQLSTKAIMETLTKARQIYAQKKKAEVLTLFDQYGGNVVADKVIDKQGRYVLPYNDQFEIDKDKSIAELAEARDKYGYNSKEYWWAKLKKDEFFAENVEQVAVPEYYIETNKALRTILENDIDSFLQYKELQKELRDIAFKDDDSDEIISRRMEINKVLIPNLLKKSKYLVDYLDTERKIKKKYKSSKQNETWRKLLDKNLTIIEEYDRQFGDLSVAAKCANNPEYEKAYHWISNNANYRLIPKVYEKVQEVFDSFQDSDTLVENENTLTRMLFSTYGAYDKKGRPDPNKIPQEALRDYKASLQEAMNKRVADGDASLLLKSRGSLSDINSDDFVLYSKDFYKLFKRSTEDLAFNIEKQNIIKEINTLLENAGVVTKYASTENSRNKELDLVKLFEQSDGLLIELKDLLNRLENLNNERTKDNKVSDNFKKYAEITIDNEQFKKDETTLLAAGINDHKMEYFYKIFAYIGKDGVFETDDEGNKTGRSLLYGILTPKEEYKKQFTDDKRKEAIRYIRKNIEFKPSSKYFDKLQEMKTKTAQEFNDWFELNHIYNPVEKRYEPIRIWTEMHVKEDGDIKDAYSWEPNYENTRYVFDDKYINPNRGKTPNNYRIDSGRYTNERYRSLFANKESNEYKMYDLLYKLGQEYAIGTEQENFAKQYAPRQYDIPMDLKEGAKEVLGLVGINLNVENDQWVESVNYNTDRTPRFNMFEFLKTRNTKQTINIEPKDPKETEEQYKERVKKQTEYNKKVEQENLKADNAVLDRNWREVFKNLIDAGEDMKARQKVKNMLYLMIDEIKNNKAYDISLLTDNLRRDSKSSIDDVIADYAKVDRKNLYEMYQTFARRIIYDAYKKPNKFNKVGKVLQGTTSSIYMSFNAIGGIANIVTGYNNMLLEMLAKDYYDMSSIRLGARRFRKNMISIIADSNREDCGTLESGLVKLFAVLDYDEHIGERDNKGLRKITQKVSKYQYGFNTGGEFLMHQHALFAGLEANRVYFDSYKNEWVIGTFNDYIHSIEVIAVERGLEKYAKDNGIKAEEFKKLYNTYINNISKDPKSKYKYETYKEDRIAKFLRYITNNDEHGKELVKIINDIKKESLKDAKKKFESEETLISQFVFNTNKNGRGYAELKANSKLFTDSNGKVTDYLGYDKLSSFINKTRKINDKIHGVYDKLGRATIENSWWGSLITQYHKHLYPGFMKRYRGAFGNRIGKVYYNELRNTVEKGSYISLFDLLVTDLRDAIETVKEKGSDKIGENGELLKSEFTVLDSINELIKGAANSIFHIRLNYNTLPEWEKHNIRRACGDIFSMLGTLIITSLLYYCYDDDDEENNIIVANGMYLASRCYSEAAMWFPTGLISEGSALYSTPVAAFSSIGDASKILQEVSKYFLSLMFDDYEYDPDYTTGKYSGQNKVGVRIKKNIPAYRIVDQFKNRGKYNAYYNGGVSLNSRQSLIKKIIRDNKD